MLDLAEEIYLVVWSDKSMWDRHPVDRHKAFDLEEHAQRFYESLLSEESLEGGRELYSASLCVCVKSTDYTTVKEVVWQ